MSVTKSFGQDTIQLYAVDRQLYKYLHSIPAVQHLIVCRWIMRHHKSCRGFCEEFLCNWTLMTFALKSPIFWNCENFSKKCKHLNVLSWSRLSRWFGRCSSCSRSRSRPTADRSQHDLQMIPLTPPENQGNIRKWNQKTVLLNVTINYPKAWICVDLLQISLLTYSVLVVWSNKKLRFRIFDAPSPQVALLLVLGRRHGSSPRQSYICSQLDRWC